MTFDSNVSTTFAGVIADIRDKVSGMANWGVADTSANGGQSPLPIGEWFVLSTPTGENIRIAYDDGTVVAEESGGLTWDYGPNWDAGTSSWGDKYNVDASHLDFSSGEGLIPCSDDISMEAADSITYQAYYADGDGFVWYLDRNEGDGYDGDMIVGFAEVTKTWDYDNAANREGDYAIAYKGRTAQSGDTVDGTLNATGAGSKPRAPSTTDAYGRTNPDGNFDNFPIQQMNLVASRQYSGASNTNAIIGTHDVWMDDESGSDSAHLDTVQDSGGTNIFTLCSAHDLNVGIKM